MGGVGSYPVVSDDQSGDLIRRSSNPACSRRVGRRWLGVRRTASWTVPHRVAEAVPEAEERAQVGGGVTAEEGGRDGAVLVLVAASFEQPEGHHRRQSAPAHVRVRPNGPVVRGGVVRSWSSPRGEPAVRRLICVPALVADVPLRSGFVVDVHAEGPRIYAQERYLLSGAGPGIYPVVLQVDFARGATSRRPRCPPPNSRPTLRVTRRGSGRLPRPTLPAFPRSFISSGSSFKVGRSCTPPTAFALHSTD